MILIVVRGYAFLKKYRSKGHFGDQKTRPRREDERRTPLGKPRRWLSPSSSVRRASRSSRSRSRRSWSRRVRGCRSRWSRSRRGSGSHRHHCHWRLGVGLRSWQCHWRSSLRLSPRSRSSPANRNLRLRSFEAPVVSTSDSSRL